MRKLIRIIKKAFSKSKLSLALEINKLLGLMIEREKTHLKRIQAYEEALAREKEFNLNSRMRRRNKANRKKRGQ